MTSLYDLADTLQDALLQYQVDMRDLLGPSVEHLKVTVARAEGAAEQVRHYVAEKFTSHERLSGEIGLPSVPGFEAYRIGPEAEQALQTSGQPNVCIGAGEGGEGGGYGFGKPLDQQMLVDGVPVVLRKLLVTIEGMLDIEGIYRLSGVRSKVETLVSDLRQGVPLGAVDDVDVHCAAVSPSHAWILTVSNQSTCQFPC